MFKPVLFAIVFTAFSAFSLGLSAAEARTALITGANRGIGLELATQLKAKGYQVIGTARKPAEAAELKALGVRVEALDVTNAASVKALAARLEGVGIDLLINNAGIGGGSAASFSEWDIESMATTFDVNSIGPMRVTQALLDNIKAGQGKQIVHISSIMGSIGTNWGGSYDYRASKAALNMLNSSLAIELGKDGMICVVLHPGWVKTRMGGETAPTEIPDSVAGMVAVIEGLEKKDNGQFYDFQGKTIPW